jgi:hypothetical protein
MILACVNHIASKLNQFLKATFELSEDIVIVSNLVENDGSTVAQTNNKVVVFVANLEKDTMPKSQNQSNWSSSGRMAVTNAPVFLNLQVVVAANFSGANYPEALKFISQVVSFFQSQPMFNRHNSPDLDPKIDKLILDIENVQRHDLSSMWSMFGAKYMPSIVYRVRMVTLAGDAVQGQVDPVKQGEVQINT